MQSENRIIKDVLNAFPHINADDDLMDVLYSISDSMGYRFMMIIDEWDAILREMGTDEYITTSYVDLLRCLFKGSGSNDVFAGAYLTGILPIKRYNTEYVIHREYATGKGYADLVMIPRRNVSILLILFILIRRHQVYLIMLTN